MAATRSSAPPTGMVARRWSTLRRRAGSAGGAGGCPARGRFRFSHTAMVSSLSFPAANGAPWPSSPQSCLLPGGDAVRLICHYTRTSVKNGTSAWLLAAPQPAGCGPMPRSPEFGPGWDVTLAPLAAYHLLPGYTESPSNQRHRRLACEGAGFRLRPIKSSLIATRHEMRQARHGAAPPGPPGSGRRCARSQRRQQKFAASGLDRPPRFC